MTAAELAGRMHADSVDLWNLLQSEVGEDYFAASRERERVEAVQQNLTALAWPGSEAPDGS